MSETAAAPRPFRTLGVRPFLWVQPADLAQIQSQFHKLSRQFHPDRFINADDESRAQAEARSAELNFDYSRLRDPWSLLDAVLNAESSQMDSAPARSAAGSMAPPDLAADYFELQEAWMEGDAVHAATQDAVQKFLVKVAAGRALAEEAVFTLAQRFPFSGFGESPAPWTQEDLEKLRRAVHNVRYYRSFERDIRAKFVAAAP